MHRLLHTLIIFRALCSLASAFEADAISIELLNHSDVHIDETRSDNHAEYNRTYIGEKPGIQVASFDYHHVKEPIIIILFVLLLAVMKIGFENTHCLNQFIPESCLLMVFGVAFGALFLVKKVKMEFLFLTFDSRIFFLYLLPPVILEAAYTLRDRMFTENMGTILLYAMAITLFNTVVMAPILYGFYVSGLMGNHWTLTFLECLIFSSLVAAVDPVPVLAIFGELGVNKLLYFLVFGESLLNDGISVVVYNTVLAYTQTDTIGAKELVLGVATFICVCIGCVVIGLLCGFATAFLTRFSSKATTAEPILMFGFAYLSFVAAEMFHFSGILSMIVCGIIQCHFATENMASKSYITILHMTKVMSGYAETIIFISLSLTAVDDAHIWWDFNVCFALVALTVCILGRIVGIFGLTYFINKRMSGFREISLKNQIIMAFSGLRGAISFSLVFSLDHNLLTNGETTKNIMVTSAYVIIFFSSFLQGITVKPLVKLLKVELDTDEERLLSEINRKTLINVCSGIEAIADVKGNYYANSLFRRLSNRYLRPWIQRQPHSLHDSLLFTDYQSMIRLARAKENCMDSDIETHPPSSACQSKEIPVRWPISVSALSLAEQDYNRKRVNKKPNFIVTIPTARTRMRGNSPASGSSNRASMSKINFDPAAVNSIDYELRDLGQIPHMRKFDVSN